MGTQDDGRAPRASSHPRHEYLLRLPAPMRRRALRAALGEAFRDGRLGVVGQCRPPRGGVD